MGTGNIFIDWINRTDTHENSDENRSIPSECAILDLSQMQRSSDNQTTIREERVHGKLYDAEEQWWQKFKKCLILMGDRIGERLGERVDNTREILHNNSRLVLVVAVAAVFIVIGVIVASVTLSSGKDKPVVVIPDDSEGGGFDFVGIGDKNTPTSILIKGPTYSPSTTHLKEDTTMPSEMPSTSEPSSSLIPSRLPSALPSITPSSSPSTSPSTSAAPTQVASSAPTYVPTVSIEPVARSPIEPFSANETVDSILTFCVIADAPYTKEELAELPDQIATQMEGCEFLVHLGDIFVGDTPCLAEDYQTIRDVMIESDTPAFLVPGDNEWNDCIRSEIDIGWDHWTNHFVGFENNWNHTFSVVRQPGYEENFYFIKKRSLVFGLNIVGGRVHNETEWETRLRSEYNWVREVMLLNLVDMKSSDGVIIMAHAHPSEDHHEFFNAFRVFLRDELKNEFPVLYLHGDGHDFLYTPSYHNQSNFLRIQHEGGTNEPILKIMAGPGRGPEGRSSVHNAFQYDRQLDVFPSRVKEKNK